MHSKSMYWYVLYVITQCLCLTCVTALRVHVDFNAEPYMYVTVVLFLQHHQLQL